MCICRSTYIYIAIYTYICMCVYLYFMTPSLRYDIFGALKVALAAEKGNTVRGLECHRCMFACSCHCCLDILPSVVFSTPCSQAPSCPPLFLNMSSGRICVFNDLSSAEYRHQSITSIFFANESPVPCSVPIVTQPLHVLLQICTSEFINDICVLKCLYTVTCIVYIWTYTWF